MRKLIALAALAAGMAFAQAPATGVQAQVRKRLLKVLDLTDAQKQQAKVIFQDTRSQVQPLAAQVKTDRAVLATAVQTGDATKIQRVALDMGNLQGHVLAIRSAGMAKFYALLTPEQKAKAVEFQQKVKQVLGGQG